MKTINQRNNFQPDSSKVKYKAQERKVFEHLFLKPSTMKEVDVSTGVMRENICRYVRIFREQNKIAVIRKRFCNITNHLAAELTTNPTLFPPKPKQGDLFETGEAAKKPW